MKKLLPFIFLMLLFISCKQDNDETLEKTVNSVDVYVAGKENGVACYWKNNTKTNLTDGTGKTARKIIVENNDIYIFASSDVFPTNYYLWKNNVKINIDQYIGTNLNTTSLADYYHLINDFQVDQGNIYFFGILRSPITLVPPTGTPSYTNELCYWKNGIKTVLFTESYPFSLAHVTTRNFTIYNGQVYVPVHKFLNNNSDSPYELGYYINSTYHAISSYSDQKSFRHISTGSNGVYLSIYDKITDKTYYRNLITNTDTYVSQTEKGKFNLDGNDIYDFSNGPDYLKNDIAISLNYASGFDTMVDLSALNHDIYQIRSKSTNDVIDSYKVYINNTEVQHMNSVNGIFTSIFAVQN